MARPLRYFGAPGTPVRIGDEVVPCITSYEELYHIMRVFAEPTSKVTRVGIIGPPGLGKSKAYLQTLGSEFCGGRRQYHLLAANRSACCSFEQIRDEPDKTIPAICDDCDRIATARDYMALVRQMAERETVRQLHWETRGIKVEDGRRTEFRGKVLVVMNDVPTFNIGVMAILNRLTIYCFNPPKAQILDFAKANMPEVPREHIDLLREIDCLPNLRLLHRMSEWDAIGGDKYVRRQVHQVCGVAPDVTRIVEIIGERPKRKRIKELAIQTGRSYDTARKAWSKYAPVAEQQLKARKTNDISS